MNRPENTAGALGCDLAAEILRTFGELRLRVFGTSMVPSILPGDLISVRRCGIDEISRGEIVLYSREGRLFAHRVVACANSADQSFLIARGDRHNHNDLPVCSAELLGRVTSIQGCDGRGGRQLESPGQRFGPNYLVLRTLRTSDLVTSIYLRLAALWRVFFPWRTNCRA